MPTASAASAHGGPVIWTPIEDGDFYTVSHPGVVVSFMCAQDGSARAIVVDQATGDFKELPLTQIRYRPRQEYDGE